MSNGHPGHGDDLARVDAVHRALAGTYRRTVVRYLRDQESATAEELVDNVRANTETDSAKAAVAVRLHHVTLPTLAAAAVVEYDVEAGTVYYSGDELLERHLRSAVAAAGDD